MAKIHTHYDNLKVARMAPQEVIRAAYKALSQKYHPDKNPGDEKAARIMAIVNTAYTALNDPVRRREHDAWIAAEEWEVAWVESTRHEEGSRPGAVPDWQGHEGQAAPHAHAHHTPLVRTVRRYLALLLAAGVGAAVAMGMAFPDRILPLVGLAPVPVSAPVPVARVAPAAQPEPGWAVAHVETPDGEAGPAPKISVLATTGLVIAAGAPDCSRMLQAASAPNGEPWPERSGYVAGYPLGNSGKQMQVFIDNSANAAPVFINIYDLDRNANVRHVYILAGDTFNVSELAAGKYEVRYQDVAPAANPAGCPSVATTEIVHSGT